MDKNKSKDQFAKKKPFYKRKKYWVIAAVVIIAIFVFRGISQGAQKAVETATITKGTVTEEIVFSGEIRAVNHAKLSFLSGGNLSWVGVKLGDSVKKGQALAKVDTTIANSTYQQSLANLRIAEATVARVHDDLKGKDTTETFVEKEERVAAEASKDKAYDAFIAAQKALRDATIVAPFDGQVTFVANESAGVAVSPATAQVEVIDPATVYFLINADQTEVSRFKIGDKADITLDAFDEQKIEGVITAVSYAPSLEESGTVYPIRLSMNQATAQNYRLGLTGDARFVLSQKENVLSVPSKFVKTDREGKFIYTDEKKTKKYIQVGIEGEDKTEISGDISEGQTVYN